MGLCSGFVCSPSKVEQYFFEATPLLLACKRGQILDARISEHLIAKLVH